MHHEASERGAMVYRYVGNKDEGAHLTGIPASHLYEEDWKHLSSEQKAAVVADAKRDKPQVFKSVEASEPAASSKSAAGSKAPAKSRE